MQTYEHDPLPWKILASRYVYERRPYVAVREDQVQLGNGNLINDYFIFEYRNWVIVLALTADEQFVLIRQYRHGVAAVHFELCAGAVEEADGLLETAQRELLEETGYGGGEWTEWLTASANPATHTNFGHIFLARNVVRLQDPSLEDTEEIAVHLLDAQEVKDQLLNGGIVQALHAAALWKYFAING